MYPTVSLESANQNSSARVFIRSVLLFDALIAKYAHLDLDSSVEMHSQNKERLNDDCRNVAEALGLPEPTASNGGLEAIREFSRRYGAPFPR